MSETISPPVLVAIAGAKKTEAERMDAGTKQTDARRITNAKHEVA